MNDDLLDLLEKQGVDCSDIIKEDFSSMAKGEFIEIYLKDESGICYLSYLLLDHLEIDGVERDFEVWLDFNILHIASNQNQN